MSCTLGGKFSSLLLSSWCIGAQSTGPPEWDQNNSIRLAEISFQAVCRPLSTGFASVRIPHNALGLVIDSSQVLSGIEFIITLHFSWKFWPFSRCASVAFALPYYRRCVWVSSSVSSGMWKCRCFYWLLEQSSRSNVRLSAWLKGNSHLGFGVTPGTVQKRRSRTSGWKMNEKRKNNCLLCIRLCALIGPGKYRVIFFFHMICVGTFLLLVRNIFLTNIFFGHCYFFAC